MDTEDELQFYQDVHVILDVAKSKLYEAANNIMTYAYWNVGERIIEQEQKGKAIKKQNTDPVNAPGCLFIEKKSNRKWKDRISK